MTTGSRILIVEDEAIIAMDLADTLSAQGYRIIATVSSGEEAIALCQTHRPDLVLMDIRLQGQLTGLETARLLRETLNIPSVLLTAFYDPGILQEAQAAGVFAYLIKPFDERELCATTTTAINRAREEQRLHQQLAQLSASSNPPTADSRNGCPTLYIQALGPHLELRLHDVVLTSEKMSRVQREMLSLILTAPQCRINREELEAELWPESPQEKARAAFDSTMLRLRRLLKETLHIENEKEYLSVKNGVVSLEWSSIDLLHFQQFDKEGREFRKSGNMDEAIRQLEAACAIWQGELLGRQGQSDRIIDLRRYTTRRFLDNCLLLGEYYEKCGRFEDGIAILNRALRTEPGDEAIVTGLVLMLRRSDRPGEAYQILRQYEKSLLKDGLTSHEIHESLRKIEQRALLAKRTP